MPSSRPTPILFLLPHLDLGGGARRITVYCEHLDKSIYKPVVVIRSAQVIRNLDGVIGEDTPRLISEDKDQMISFAKQQGVRVVYTWYDGQFHQDLYEVLTGLKALGVAIIANNVFSYYDQRMDDLCDRVIFQTHMMLEIKFKKNFPSHFQFSYQKYRHLYNPVHLQRMRQFALTPAARAAARQHYGFLPDDIVIGRFGRNDIVKFGDELLGALWHFRGQPHVKFFITGMPRSRRYLIRVLQQFLPKLQRQVIILPPTADDQELMQRVQVTDVIAHSVRIGEGCSNAINEAMYWSKPVVTNSTPHCDNGQVEQVDHRQTGLVVANTAGFCAALQRLVQSRRLRVQYGAAGHKKVITQYAGQKIAQQLGALLNEVITDTVDQRVITQHEKECQAFRSQYMALMKKMGSTKRSGLQQFFSTIIRVCNYIEYRYFNG